MRHERKRKRNYGHGNVVYLINMLSENNPQRPNTKLYFLFKLSLSHSSIYVTPCLSKSYVLSKTRLTIKFNVATEILFFDSNTPKMQFLCTSFFTILIFFTFFIFFALKKFKIIFAIHYLFKIFYRMFLFCDNEGKKLGQVEITFNSMKCVINIFLKIRFE